MKNTSNTAEMGRQNSGGKTNNTKRMSARKDQNTRLGGNSPALLTVAAMIAAFATTAFAGSKNGLNTFDFGNENAGAKGNYSVTVSNGPKYAQTVITATGKVKFLKKTVPGVDFSATLENSNGRKTANYTLKVAGYVVDTGAKATSFVWKKVANKTLVSAAVGIVVGAVPVTLQGSVGGGGSVGLNFQLSTTGVGVSGEAAVFSNGSASAGVGVPVLNIALRSDLQMGKTSLKPSLTVEPTKWSGNAKLVFDPVKIDLGVVLQTKNRVWYRQDLASYAAPSKSVALLSL